MQMDEVERDRAGGSENFIPATAQNYRAVSEEGIFPRCPPARRDVSAFRGGIAW
jgi:hypothetical protein